MKRVHNGLLAWTGALALAAAGIACENTADGVKQDTAETTQEARDAAAKAKAEATQQSAEARAQGRETAADAKAMASNAGAAINAAKETADVKAALTADNTVDASAINVDTHADTMTVVLKGYVRTEAQKTTAARIAAREAEGFKVDNQLVVRP